MITHTPLLAGYLLIKTLVARQQPTIHHRSHLHALVCINECMVNSIAFTMDIGTGAMFNLALLYTGTCVYVPINHDWEQLVDKTETLVYLHLFTRNM